MHVRGTTQDAGAGTPLGNMQPLRMSFQSAHSRWKCLVKEQNIDFAVKTPSSSPPADLFTQRYWQEMRKIQYVKTP